MTGFFGSETPRIALIGAYGLSLRSWNFLAKCLLKDFCGINCISWLYHLLWVCNYGCGIALSFAVDCWQPRILSL